MTSNRPVLYCVGCGVNVYWVAEIEGCWFQVKGKPHCFHCGKDDEDAIEESLK